jgi:hypothetical protein
MVHSALPCGALAPWHACTQPDLTTSASEGNHGNGNCPACGLRMFQDDPERQWH